MTKKKEEEEEDEEVGEETAAAAATCASDSSLCTAHPSASRGPQVWVPQPQESITTSEEVPVDTHLSVSVSLYVYNYARETDESAILRERIESLMYKRPLDVLIHTHITLTATINNS